VAVPLRAQDNSRKPVAPGFEPWGSLHLGYPHFVAAEAGLLVRSRWRDDYWKTIYSSEGSAYLTGSVSPFSAALHSGFASLPSYRDVSPMGRIGLYARREWRISGIDGRGWGGGLEGMLGLRELGGIEASVGWLNGIDFSVGLVIPLLKKRD